MKLLSVRLASVFLVASVVLTQACSPVPRHDLTLAEKQTDLNWIYRNFEQYYAPLDFKQQKWGFKYDDLKIKYLKDAESTKNNEEFYALMLKFVAEFHDAHTSASLTAADLPGRANVAYLGFTGKRKGDNLVVTSLLPTIAGDANYPIKVGDVITKLDGVALTDIVKSTFVSYRNLGSDEANQTYFMNKIFSRLSISLPMPTADSATLTVGTDAATQKSVKLPWVVKDLVQFTNEQSAAVASKKMAAMEKKLKELNQPKESKGLAQADDKIENGNGLTDQDIENIFSLGFFALGGGDSGFLPSSIKSTMPHTKDFNMWKTFQFIDTIPDWNSKYLRNVLREYARFINTGVSADATPSDEFASERKIPDNAIIIASAKTYPAYIMSEPMKDKDGKETGAKKTIGYIYLNTFEPAGAEDDVVKEFTQTLIDMEASGVNDVIIDMLNNGGGSLSLGMRLAQSLSKDPITQPSMQFRLSDTWLDQYQETSIHGATDTDRQYATKIYNLLNADLAAGQTLSRPLSGEYLMDYPFNGTSKLAGKLNVVLMVNEMCASMCDIFTGIMKDNQLATTVGQRTMGAGGNVVQHFQSPSSHLILNQTESLIVRKDGSYIENSGVDADVEIGVSLSSDSKYEDVRQKAVDVLTLSPTPAPSAIPVAPASPQIVAQAKSADVAKK